MPAPLSQNFNLQQLEVWIDNNVHLPSVTPISINLNLVPHVKGIYLWFMKPEGYLLLSRNLENTQLYPVIPIIEKEGYHLVYLGTAGTGKSGGGNLFQRLNWHIAQKHGISSICSEKSPALSTFRTGIGSLISDDLILCPPTSTELEVNRIFKEYFKVYWIEYGNGQENQIDEDEKILIQKIKPIFNIRNNPNAKISGTPTYFYQQRRQNVVTSTKTRLGCLNTNDKRKKIKTNSCTFDKDGVTYVLSFEGKAILARNGQVETIKIKPFLRELIVQKQLPIAINNNKGKALTTHELAKAVIDYYQTNSEEVQPIRCKTDSVQAVSSKIPPIEAIKTKDFKVPELIKGKALIILNCSSDKRKGGKQEQTVDYFDNSEIPEIVSFRDIRNNLINLLSNPTLNIVENSAEMLKAYKRYTGHFYKTIDWEQIDTKNQQGCLHVVIVSALFGVIEYNRTIPYYDLKITQVNAWGNFIQEAIDCYIEEKAIKNTNVFSFLSKDYAHLIPNQTHYKRKRGSNQRDVGKEVNKIVEKVEC